MDKVILELTRITRQVGLVNSPAEQVRLIVESISEAIAVDVCSLYRSDVRGDMLLLASHGLDTKGKVVIPAGRGLVGMVASGRHPLNLAEGASHQHYLYIPETESKTYLPKYASDFYRTLRNSSLKPAPPMPDGIRNQLRDYYRDDVVVLAKLTNLRVDQWGII